MQTQGWNGSAGHPPGLELGGEGHPAEMATAIFNHDSQSAGWAGGDSGDANGKCQSMEIGKDTVPLGAAHAVTSMQMCADAGRRGHDRA